MIKSNIGIFIYQKDFTDKGADRYFLNSGGFFEEKTVNDIVNFDGSLITHDYWLIAPSIFNALGQLPKNVVDLTELAKLLTGKKLDKEIILKTSIKFLLKSYYSDKKDLEAFFEQYYRRLPLSIDTYQLFSHHMISAWETLSKEAIELDEATRFLDIELPVFNLITKVANKGIKLNIEKLREYKNNIDFDYYRELKRFAIDYDLLFEIPSSDDLKDQLLARGYDLDELSTKFILKFLPMADDFGNRLISLQKLKKSRVTLANISLSRLRVSPIAETHSTVTSRIYYKNPTIQNLSKKYRDIFVADEGYELEYIDYDQFEIGIMAALSLDEKLKAVYNDSDVYKKFAIDVFNDEKKRALSKKLFLAFTYGMTIGKILQSVYEQGGNKAIAREFFEQFIVFSEWKSKVESCFLEHGKISTLLGNYLIRSKTGPLTFKEKRSCISHVVQGTGSLIFKKALLDLSMNPQVDILIPMHDAVLVQHLPTYNKDDLILVFENAMNTLLKKVVNSKASLEKFSV